MDNSYKIRQIKYTKYHFMSGKIYLGCPIITFVEIKKEFDFTSKKEIIKKIVTHKYYCDENSYKVKENITEEILAEQSILEKVADVNLVDLRNNYFTDKNPERFSHWEIEYNNRFKIVGTFDQELDEVKMIKELLDFENIEKVELDKAKMEILSSNQSE